MLIRVVDLETCGLEPPAGICEIGFCDLVKDGQEWIVGRPANLLVDPGMPIPPETSAVHHIVDEDVAGAPDFAAAARVVFFDEERMLTPRERFLAQGFRPDYVIDRGLLEDGTEIPLTLEQQGRMCGNSVCPGLARALVAANYREAEDRQRDAAPMPLFAAE